MLEYKSGPAKSKSRTKGLFLSRLLFSLLTEFGLLMFKAKSFFTLKSILFLSKYDSFWYAKPCFFIRFAFLNFDTHVIDKRDKYTGSNLP